MKHKLERIAPEATIGIVHGRLSEDNLEHVMLDFVAGNIDILLATTIVESGLDIPRGTIRSLLMKPITTALPTYTNFVDALVDHTIVRTATCSLIPGRI